ncbi:MAG: 2-oxoglutarate ferredoxin oxidoreductase subunit alpha [marine bacterium B5-7]|nr:MAG: 2-oxoglutarate ferredoxin oxidoreductase subunit alpha [marine bacterium B5-7]
MKKTINILFAGDSGDGMQVTGMQFTNTAAIFGHDVQSLPDFPAEIRAPAGTLPGVSGMQITFSENTIHAPADTLDVLIAMNPAALIVNLPNLKPNGIIILNEDSFKAKDLQKARLDSHPLEDGKLQGYQTFPIPLTQLTLNAIGEHGLTHSQAGRSKNMFALGLVYWLFDKTYDETVNWLENKYQQQAALVQANQAALKAGYNFALTSELFAEQYPLAKAKLPPGTYRQINGNEAFALAFAAVAHQSQQKVLVSGYPITPASTVLHDAAQLAAHNVDVFQAEDEIAAMGATIGAAYGGSLAMTVTSGPGLDLKGEGIGLAVMTELPMVIIDVQRAGPSTGMPTKPEQTDLLQAIFGRHGECPLPVLAPKSAGDCFNMLLEASQIAINYMTPVIILSDSYLATGAEPWRLPDVATLPILKPNFAKNIPDFKPYQRDENLARPWAVPGTAGLEHRIGGLEKEKETGDVCYDPQNHADMVALRAKKIEHVARDYAPLSILGEGEADVLVIGWGSTHGAILTAAQQLQAAGSAVHYLHLRHLFPLHNDLGDVLTGYKKVVVAELNQGQLTWLLRAKYLKDVQCISKVSGKPFLVSELVEKIKAQCHDNINA